MYDDFKKYLKQNKRNFNERRFDQEQMYRAVCFGQFGVPYKYERHNLPNDYDDLKWEVYQFQNRIKRY